MKNLSLFVLLVLILGGLSNCNSDLNPFKRNPPPVPPSPTEIKEGVGLLGTSRMDKVSGDSYDSTGYPDELLEPGGSFRGEFDEGVYKGLSFCCSCSNGGKQFKKRVQLTPFKVTEGETVTIQIDCNKGNAEILSCD